MIKDIIPTPMDIMQMLMKFSEEMNDRFDKVDKRFDDMQIYMDRRFDLLETRVERIEKNMVHKSQFKSLVDILERKEVITNFDASHVLYRPSE